MLNHKKHEKEWLFFIEEPPVDILAISGEFIELPKYMLAKREVPGKFIKNELSDTNRGIYNTGQLGQPYTLLKNKNSEEYYYVMEEDFLTYIFQKQVKDELVGMIHQLGYKEYQDEYGMLRMKSKTCEIKLNERTYFELKKDSNYITNLDNDQQKLSTLVKQSLPHSKTLDKYLSIYNIQSSNMSSTDLKAWRRATENAQKLQNQIYVITQKYAGNTSFVPLNKSNDLNNFLDNLLASKGVLGM